jgi:hypothetical protein
MLYDYLIIPSLISGITYVNYIRSDDIYRIMKLNKYYFYNYSLFDSIFILLYFFILGYDLLLIYYSAKVCYKKYKKYIKDTFNFDSILINIDYDKINEKECSVCLEDFDNTKQICQLVQCTHLFHKTCIINWYNISNQLSCPYCRCIYECSNK